MLDNKIIKKKENNKGEKSWKGWNKIKVGMLKKK